MSTLLLDYTDVGTSLNSRNNILGTKGHSDLYFKWKFSNLDYSLRRSIMVLIEEYDEVNHVNKNHYNTGYSHCDNHVVCRKTYGTRDYYVK
jgi:hypothetical protein